MMFKVGRYDGLGESCFVQTSKLKSSNNKNEKSKLEIVKKNWKDKS